MQVAIKYLIDNVLLVLKLIFIEFCNALYLFQIKKSSLATLGYDLMKPTTSKLLQPIVTLAVTPKTKPAPLRKTIKKPVTGGILKKSSKKRKMTASKQKAVASSADSALKMWCLEKKNTPLRILDAEQWKKK